MRTIKIQATPATERLMTEWLAHLVLAISTGPDGGAIIFDGDLGNGIVVAQRHEGRWSVSFRPNLDGSRIRHYANPHVVARVILSNPRQHDEAAALDPLQDERDVTADPLACTGMEPAPGSPALLHLADRERPAGYGWRGVPPLGPFLGRGDVDAAPFDGGVITQAAQLVRASTCTWPLDAAGLRRSLASGPGLRIELCRALPTTAPVQGSWPSAAGSSSAGRCPGVALRPTSRYRPAGYGPSRGRADGRPRSTRQALRRTRPGPSTACPRAVGTCSGG